MRFLDANVFIYAYYKPKRQLTSKEKQMKDEAKNIITRVSQGKEEVVTSVVHVSEIVNILKHGMPQDQLTGIIRGLFMLDNVTINEVTREAYFAATELGDDMKLEANDALAVDVLKTNGISEIYSFDEHFDKIEGITRLPSI
ncbi:type II toxin-antitoxin system VapC family toxin [Candidatus Bathyarchaeota archaeon A05DMB-2]|jgi:predicted nucleic acid-binding protein|nr:type II toxin-antitoxin system VapC family toxin [Candidatus Bathyarchaeota archaeon A05DMB-2]